MYCFAVLGCMRSLLIPPNSKSSEIASLVSQKVYVITSYSVIHVSGLKE